MPNLSINSRTFVSLALVVMPALIGAQTPIRLHDDDVYFQFAGLNQTPAAGVVKGSVNRLCGFMIHGNHGSWSNPHVEWDLNIDEIVTSSRTVAGVSAGTFDVKDHKRIPRPPIIQMSFALKGVPDPIAAEVRGKPNADNGIVALIEAEPASRLFSEFQSMRPIIISLRYSDGSSDALEVRGFRDERKFGGGKNSYFNQCLSGFLATHGGMTRPIP